MRCLIFLGLLAMAQAEIGAKCQMDSDCDDGETCVMLPKPGEQEIPDEGSCYNKRAEYDFCLMDTNCEDGMTCTKHPLVETPLPVIGVCTMCTSDLDCAGDEYCDHPIMNLMCLETLMHFEMLGKKKEKDEKMKMMMMKRMMGGEMGSDMGDMGSDMGEMKRKKRGIGLWTLNGPTLRCMAKKESNSPCRRSAECDSKTCSVEGSCK